MEKIALNIKKWISANSKEFILIFILLLIAAFCRLYKIDQYLTFLGDEGRDVIIVRRLLTELHPPLIGPGTSIGNMYLGPLYYYLMAPALLIANFSPVGPAIMVAFLGVVTVGLVWYFFRELFPSKERINWGALIAAGLFAISPTVIIYSRSSWNPNIMPFFATLAVFSVWKVYKDHKFNWLYVLGISFAAVLQSHYLGLILASTLALFWFLTAIHVFKDVKLNKLKVEFLKKSFYGLVLFILMMSPLFFFDVRHNWINSKAMYNFFTVRQETVSIRPWTAIPKIPKSFEEVNLSLVAAKNETAGYVLTWIFLISLVVLITEGIKNSSRRNPQFNSEFLLLTSWIGFALVGFGLYKQHIYDHYFGFIFPVPFLLMGVVVNKLISYKILGKIAAAVIVVYFVAVNINASPLKSEPGNQLRRAREVANKIKEESHGERYNLGVIAERNYEDGYKYFLLKDGQKVVNIDSQVEDSITDQLFAICELAKEKCDPTHNASAAIANFGWSKLAGEWNIDGVIIYRLVHSQ